MALDISVLITNYGAWPQAAHCAHKVIEYCGEDVSRILIMDDASEGEPPSLPDRVDVQRHETNQGFPATLNDGFKLLNEDVIVHFDADGYPLMNFAPRVVTAFSSKEELGALGFHMVDHEGETTESYIRSSSISTLRFIAGKRLSNCFPNIVEDDLLLPNTCGTAVRRDAFVSVGGFDEGFELLDVDLDFFLRIAQDGWMIEYDSKIRAYHEGGGSPQATATRVLRYHRDRWHMLSKHGKIVLPSMVKAGLALRHCIEYGVIWVLGILMLSGGEERSEKLKGRRDLLCRVWSEYR